jgi:hypothetical protein
MRCGRCGLDFQELAIRVDTRALVIDEQGLRLYCPWCRQDNTLDLRSLNMLYRGERFYRWGTSRGSTQKGEYLVEFGSLVLVFPEDRVETLTLDRMCYRAIPVFQNQDGSLSYPRLPVRKEFVAFIDMERTPPPEVNIERRLYRIELALQGLERAERVERPLLVVGRDRPVLEGAHLVLWPNVRYKPWRRYFVRFGCPPDQAGPHRIRVYARAQRPGEDSPPDWVGLKTLPSGAQVVALGSRPDWLAIEFESAALGEVVGGGLWQVEPPTAPDYPELTLTIGVDFGTSNTYLTYKVGQGGPTPLRLRDCSRYLISGSWVPTDLTTPEPWLPAQGFAPDGATLPSEIVTVESLQKLVGRSPDGWQPIEDYGILGAGVQVRYPEADHTVAGFKWQEMLQPEDLRGHYAVLQEKYLNLLLLVALANLAWEEKLGRDLEIQFAYPLSFDESMKQTLESTLQRVSDFLTQAVGLKREASTIRSTLTMDETRAASYSVGEVGPQYSAYLFVDIGGGSTDIALMVRTEKHEAFVVVDSIRYAGGALVTALSRGQCLRAGLSEAGFRRWIRETGDLGALQRMGTIFDSRREPAMVHKTQYFYGYLREYLARILAAHIVTGEWQGLGPRDGKEIRRDEKEIEIIRKEGYYIALYPLGNGWGFGSLLHPLYATRLADQLQQRTEAILREVLGDKRGDFPEIRVVAQTLPRETHPKAAVAQGILKAAEIRKIDSFGMPLRTILGWTVQAGRIRRIPWHRETDGFSVPPGEEPIKAGYILDCPPDEPPRFPSDLDGPYDIDPELKQTRQTLNRECLRGREWFIRTPLQVFMESLFKPHLERVV